MHYRKILRRASRAGDRLAEPIVISKFWRNRRGEAVAVSLRSFEGRPLIDLRVFYTQADGVLVPTPRGLTLSIKCLPDLARGINKARATARALDLIKNGAGR